MKVKDLKEMLATLDPEMDVVINDGMHDQTWIAGEHDIRVNKLSDWSFDKEYGLLGDGTNPTDEFIMISVGG